MTATKRESGDHFASIERLFCPQKHAGVIRVRMTQVEFHPSTILIGWDRVGFELAVWRDELMLPLVAHLLSEGKRQRQQERALT